jgi:hypothetical protein
MARKRGQSSGVPGSPRPTKAVFLRKVGAPSGGAAMGALHGYTQRFRQEAIFVAIGTTKNDVAARQLAGHGQASECFALHATGVPYPWPIREEWLQRRVHGSLHGYRSRLFACRDQRYGE